MTEQWDGRPQNPERDGWHWLQWVGLFPADTLAHTNPVARYWEKDGWWDGSMHRHARYWQRGWRYVAPCLTPAEVEALTAECDDWVEQARKAMIDADERVAAARREGIEAAWGVVADEPVPEGKLTFHEVMQRDERMMERIRALLEDGR